MITMGLNRGAGDECAEDAGEVLDGSEGCDLVGSGPQRGDGGEAESGLADEGAELADRLPGPQEQEVAVAPK